MSEQTTKPEQITKASLKELILIVIQPDGSHHIRLPSDDTLEFNHKAYSSMINTLTVLNEPSVVLRVMLWLERCAQRLSHAVFGS
jgi:hypothetical protein